jgi:hypothetical protein
MTILPSQPRYEPAQIYNHSPFLKPEGMGQYGGALFLLSRDTAWRNCPHYRWKEK